MSMGWTVEDLEKLMRTPEELHPDLEAYLDPDGPLGSALRHPLVYNVMHSAQMNAMVNEQYRLKREALADAMREKNWHSFIYLHERPWRIDAFTQICWRMDDQEYWKLLGGIYTDTENLWQNFDLWVDCLTAERADRHLLMTESEQAALEEDPGPYTVHRGYHDGGTAEGLSWTTSTVTAEFFAQRLAPEGAAWYVATGQVERENVVAYFEARNEHEMVVLPGGVQNITTKQIGDR